MVSQMHYREYTVKKQKLLQSSHVFSYSNIVILMTVLVFYVLFVLKVVGN